MSILNTQIMDEVVKFADTAYIALVTKHSVSTSVTN